MPHGNFSQKIVISKQEKGGTILTGIVKEILTLIA